MHSVEEVKFLKIRQNNTTLTLDTKKIDQLEYQTGMKHGTVVMHLIVVVNATVLFSMERLKELTILNLLNNFQQ